MVVKICKVHGELTIDKVYPSSFLMKNGQRYERFLCKDCQSEYQIKRYNLKKDEYSKKRKQYYEANKERHIRYSHDYFKKNYNIKESYTAAIKSQMNKKAKRQRDKCSDAYIRKLLKLQLGEEPTIIYNPRLIEFKRAVLQLKRGIINEQH